MSFMCAQYILTLYHTHTMRNTGPYAFTEVSIHIEMPVHLNMHIETISGP